MRVAMAKGETVPDGYLLDADGRPTGDPSVMFRTPLGALLPFGEHKGSALALAVELLAGALLGGFTQSGASIASVTTWPIARTRTRPPHVQFQRTT
jgi:LDH2 family malate/lactate/ureidoglycolate dehydrogenase